ncbi:S1C family serine protease [Sutcliffiella halmapala]|uniref:S1C family serine protease n=1 Tax=Sutcliffiella halmapala TaxID=79882 RepID=UPI0009959D22|nr:S1C family serine protease [Sutcliffiella halmapala]
MREENEGLEEKKTESEEPPLKDFLFDEADKERKEKNDKKRKKIFKILSVVIIIALSVNVWGIFPKLYNLPSIQFLLKSNQLSNDKDIQEWKKAVVSINGNNKKGTGFNIDPSGTLITNYHVIEGMDPIVVTFPDGQYFAADVIATSQEYDAAVLKVEGESLPALKIQKADDLETKQHVYIIGNPLAHSFIVNDGETSGTINSGIPEPALLLDAPVHSGNSGSPVINEHGEVIAVVYATTEDSSDNKRYGLAIPIEYIIRELEID